MSDKRILEFETATSAGDTDFVPIDSLEGGTRKIPVTNLPGGGGGGGTTVVPNPVGEPEEDLNTVKIGNTIYNIPGNGGGSGGVMESVLTTPVVIGSNTDIAVSDISDADLLIFDFGILTGDNKKAHLISQMTLEALEDTTGYKFVGEFVSSYNVSFGLSKTSDTLLHIVDFYENGWSDTVYMWNIYKVKYGGGSGDSEIIPITAGDGTTSRTFTFPKTPKFIKLYYQDLTLDNGWLVDSNIVWGQAYATTLGHRVFVETANASGGCIALTYPTGDKSVTITAGNAFQACNTVNGSGFMFVDYEGGGGSDVEANPQETPTDTLETIRIGDTVYDIAGSGGPGFQITKLWNYVDDNEGVIPYRTYSALTLNDNLSNYDGVFLELVSDIQDLSDWQATCLTQIWPVEALTDSYFPMNVGYTSYGGRSSHYVFTDTTIACTQSDSNMVNGLINVYGVKFGGASGPAYEETDLFTNTGSTNPSSISLADDIRNYDEIAFYVDRTSYGGYKVQFRYTTSGIALNDRILLPLWSSDNEYISYTVSDWDEFGSMTQGNALILTKIVGIKHKNGKDYHVYDQHEKIVGEWFGEPLYEKTMVLKENGVLNYTYADNEFVDCLPHNIGYIDVVKLRSSRENSTYIDIGLTGGEVIVVPNPTTHNLYFTSQHNPPDVIVTIQYTKSTN